MPTYGILDTVRTIRTSGSLINSIICTVAKAFCCMMKLAQYIWWAVTYLKAHEWGVSEMRINQSSQNNWRGSYRIKLWTWVARTIWRKTLCCHLVKLVSYSCCRIGALDRIGIGGHRLFRCVKSKLFTMTINNQSLTLGLIAFAPSLYHSTTTGIHGVPPLAQVCSSPASSTIWEACLFVSSKSHAGCNGSIRFIVVAVITANAIFNAWSWHGLVSILQIFSNKRTWVGWYDSTYNLALPFETYCSHHANEVNHI